MSDALKFVVTDAGLAAAQNAKANGFELEITHFAAGDGQYQPAYNRTALANQRIQVAIASSRKTGSKSFEINALLEGDPSFRISELGLKTDDGVLFAVWSAPDANLGQHSAGLTDIFAFDSIFDRVPDDSINITASSPDINLHLAPELTRIATAHAHHATVHTATLLRLLQLDDRITAVAEQTDQDLDDVNQSIAESKSAASRENRELQQQLEADIAEQAEIAEDDNDALKTLLQVERDIAFMQHNSTLVGQMAEFYIQPLPDRWLELDGSIITNSQDGGIYADLVEYLNPGETQATLLDLRGEFTRGWDNGRGVDVGRGLATAQDWALENITGQFNGDDHNAVTMDGAFYPIGSQNGPGGTGAGRLIGFDASRVVKTATETRPRNIAVIKAIRF